MKNAFYCHDQGAHVVCNAPPVCHSRCQQYKAVHVTGVKVRTLKCEEDIATIDLKTGFIEGCKLILVD